MAGPPCSGKTTLVRENALPGELVIDHDLIAQALGSPDAHDHPPQLISHVLTVTELLLSQGRADPRLTRIWLVRCSPSDRDIALADEVLVAPTSKDECRRRALADGRTEQVLDAIDEWQPPPGR